MTTYRFPSGFIWGVAFRDEVSADGMDYDTQRRIVKDSGEWYSCVIASKGIVD